MACPCICLHDICLESVITRTFAFPSFILRYRVVNPAIRCPVFIFCYIVANFSVATEARQRPLSASLAEQTRRVALRSGGRASSPPADIRRKTRRRKRDSMRRHTLTGDEDRLSKEEGLRPGGRERLAKERERFLDLLRTRYPDQAEAIASELEWGGDAGKKEEQCNGKLTLIVSPCPVVIVRMLVIPQGPFSCNSVERLSEFLSLRN